MSTRRLLQRKAGNGRVVFLGSTWGWGFIKSKEGYQLVWGDKEQVALFENYKSLQALRLSLFRDRLRLL